MFTLHPCVAQMCLWFIKEWKWQVTNGIYLLTMSLFSNILGRKLGSETKEPQCTSTA